jgi:subtilisin family serine protease
MKISSILFPAFTAAFLLFTADAVRGAERHLQAPDNIVPDEYIVVFKGPPGKSGTAAGTNGNSSGNKSEVAVAVKAQGGSIKKEYSFVLNGFTARLTPKLLEALEKNPNIDYIEKNAIATASATQIINLPWGLDRIDQSKGRDGSYTYEETGAGVDVYVIDTGVDSTHSEFTGRLGNGFNAVTGRQPRPQVWDDCQGHGTHVASTIGGSKYGVAKGVTLHGVRVLDCAGSGTYSGILEGMDWVTQQHVSNPEQKSVANMSLGGGFSAALNSAVELMVAAGIVVAVAAGNNNGDACNISPASAASAITVAATDLNDRRASFSNFGTCVDIFAPGVDVLGAWYNCDTCTQTISGTSMASPHVAGVAALFLQNRSGSPSEILAAMLAKAVDIIVLDNKGSPNEFLQSTTAPGGITDSPTAAPQANPTDSPMTATTSSPVNLPTPSPLFAPTTSSPTDSITAVPTSSPVDSPILPPTGSPVTSPLLCQAVGESCRKQGCPGLIECCCDGLNCNKGSNGWCV